MLLVVLLAASLPAWAPAGLSLGRAVFDAQAWHDMPGSGVRFALLARTAGVAAIVAATATVLGMPMARVLRREGPRRAAILMAPLWLPPWLIYAGLNLARAPDTAVGRAFMQWALDPRWALFDAENNRWAIPMLGRGVAVASLVLWSSPLAALVMAGVSDPEHDAAAQALRLEPIGPARRAMTHARLRAGAIMASFVAVGLLTLGSSVPLHLAQVETDAIVLWRALSERTPNRWAGVWLAAWPQALLAAAGAWWVASRFGRRTPPGLAAPPGGSPHGARGASWAAAWAVWALALLVPVALMAGSLDSFASVWRWVWMDHEAIAATAGVSATAAVVAAGVGVATAACRASDRAWARTLGAIAAALCVFGVLLPGVLTGAAVAGLGTRLGVDGAVLSVFGAASRVVFVGAVGGLVVACSEPPDERANRSLDGAGDAWGWLRANRVRAWRLAGGVGLGAFVLGLYEIEASVMVRPPGSGNLPQSILADLHYARLEQLSAAGVAMGLVGIAVGLIAGRLLVLAPEQPRPTAAVSHPV